MLTINVPAGRLFNEETFEFIEVKATTLTLEHSLISISKWEEKWHVPYMHTENKSVEQELDYIRCMTINSNVDPNVYSFLTVADKKKINEYINDPMTATKINNKQKSQNGKKTVFTNEVIYYMMIENEIPVQFEKWHINRLMTLIEVCNSYRNPKKMSKKDTINEYERINNMRRKKYGSKG